MTGFRGGHIFEMDDKKDNPYEELQKYYLEEVEIKDCLGLLKFYLMMCNNSETMDIVVRAYNDMDYECLLAHFSIITRMFKRGEAVLEKKN